MIRVLPSCLVVMSHFTGLTIWAMATVIMLQKSSRAVSILFIGDLSKKLRAKIIIILRTSKYFGIFAIQIQEIVQRYAFLNGQLTNGRRFEVTQIANHSKQKLFKSGSIVR